MAKLSLSSNQMKRQKRTARTNDGGVRDFLKMSSESDHTCEVCGTKEDRLRCSRCQKIYYCSREHQKKDWKNHKAKCKPMAEQADHKPKCKPAAPMPKEGSSESEILKSMTENLTPQLALPVKGAKGFSAEKAFNWCSQTDLGATCQRLVHDMSNFGLCVLDNFLGADYGEKILVEVLNMHQTQGVFNDGQLVSSKGAEAAGDNKAIRGDQITWIDGGEQSCSHIKQLIGHVDTVVKRANKMPNNGKLGNYNISGRTKAMVACYPGSGARYVKHVDNPNKDGRCITAIYYLNKDWNVGKSGGLLRIFPAGPMGHAVADIEPVFDRLVFFWSDRRNPHEVQPAYATRYAITLWYFDDSERAEASKRFEQERKTNVPQDK